MSIDSLKIFYVLGIVIFMQPLMAVEKSHHNLSWIGFLHLPKKEAKPSKVLKAEELKLWKEWSQTEELPLTWLPTVAGFKDLSSNGYVLKFQPLPKEKKTRRMKGAL
jgi:hypothetical protein